MNRTLNDADDDPQLPQRGSARETYREGDRRSVMREDMYADTPPERELTLSTGTVLGIFFALALVCAVFFGFGYSMGKKSGLASAEAASAASGSGDSTGSGSQESSAGKPTAGSSAVGSTATTSASTSNVQAIPGYLGQQSDAGSRPATSPATRPAAHLPTAANGSTSVTVPLTPGAPVTRTTTPETASAAPRKPSAATPASALSSALQPGPKPAEARPLSATARPVTIPSAQPVPPVAGSTAAGASGPIYVQVAAVSHKEDADNLLTALKRRGYSAFERSLDTDKLIHIQVGPFNTKQSADAMRIRLQGDSYNAILK